MHYGQCPLEYQIQHEIFFALHRLTWKSQLLNGLTPSLQTPHKAGNKWTLYKQHGKIH